MNTLGGAMKQEIQIYKTSKKTGKSLERSPGMRMKQGNSNCRDYW